MHALLKQRPGRLTSGSALTAGLLSIVAGCSSSVGAESAACQEQARLAANECYSINCLTADPQTCSYGDITKTGDDCGCYTKHDLMKALCDAGNEDALELLEAGVVCETTNATE